MGTSGHGAEGEPFFGADGVAFLAGAPGVSLAGFPGDAGASGETLDGFGRGATDIFASSTSGSLVGAPANASRYFERSSAGAPSSSLSSHSDGR
jgi:hypothetical protein